MNIETLYIFAKRANLSSELIKLKNKVSNVDTSQIGSLAETFDNICKKDMPTGLIKKITNFSTSPFILWLAVESHCFHGHG